MKIPSVRGVIDRRILVNYRVDPDALAAMLPAPFEPKLVGGFGVGGICLIRLKHIRPQFIPFEVGIGSENAAHRIAVDWTEGSTRREGVYIPRRDTSSHLNSLVGGRVFPGIHHHATFEVEEEDGCYAVSLRSDDGRTSLRVVGRVADSISDSSIFDSVGAASSFFERGSLGYSATAEPGRYDGLELRCLNWHVEPLAIEEVASSFFDDKDRFPNGTTEFDCALLMRGIEHEWHGRSPLCACDEADA
ncbi:DUF2071 domain-containing protein [Rubrivirga sp.]|uniref:DUF2071 domain-containing protein n=1 Tax=Rubrivirga sp. TaxID=1885344 RepID=UPI003B52F534